MYVGDSRVEPVDAEVMRQPPRNPKEPIVDRALLVRVALSAVCVVTGTLAVYMVRAHTTPMQTGARTLGLRVAIPL